jgi:TonB family protein
LGLFQRAWNADPTGPHAGRILTWMAETNVSAGSTADAESLFQRALAVEAPDSSDAAMTMDLYARLLRDQNRVGEAEQMEWRVKQVRKALLAKLMPQSAPSEAVYKAGGGVAAPVLLFKMEPAYTDEARALKIQGTELLYVEIGPDGVARNFRVVQGVGYGLDEAGIVAVSQWKFKPGTRDGQAVTVAATIEINWRLM